MATYYYINAASEPRWATTSGGTPTVSTASITSADDIVFDANSGATIASIPTTFRSCNASAFQAIISFNNQAITCHGSFTAPVLGAATISFGGGSLTFASTTTGNTITCNGKNLGPTVFNGVGGEWAFQDQFNASANTAITLTNGTLNTNNQTVNCSTFTSISGTRTLNLGSSDFYCSGSGNVWNTNAALTLNAGTSTIHLTYGGTVSRAFLGGNRTYNNLVIGSLASVSSLTITGSNTFNTISSTKTGAHTIAFPITATTTVANFTVSGTSGNSVTLKTSTTGTTGTLSKTGGGTITLAYVSVQDLIATPSSTWFANNSIDNGNNTGWTITAPSAGSGLFFGSNF